MSCRYDACIEASDSDHKPVRCLLDVDLPVIDEAGWRREFGDIMQRDQKVPAFVERCNVIPHTRLEKNKIMLEGHSISTVLLTNDSKRSWTTFTVRCEGLHYNNVFVVKVTVIENAPAVNIFQGALMGSPNGFRLVFT